MDDAVRATMNIMSAPSESIKIRSSYNLGGISFTPNMISKEIKNHFPDFKISYSPDFRQAIADSWPSSINDASAQKDWNWSHDFDLKNMTNTMLKNLKAESN
jgi:nucleoside-diphosphate-sugar epimerase